MAIADYIEKELISARFIITVMLIAGYLAGLTTDVTMVGMAVAFWFGSKVVTQTNAATAAMAAEAAELPKQQFSFLFIGDDRMVTKKALIVGIDRYPAPNTLHGCVNDATAWKSYLRLKGFTVTSVTNTSATASNIKAALTALCTGTAKGDSRVFVYSGHGTQIKDLNGDEADGYDECIVPVNFTYTGRNLISDDDIRSKLDLLTYGVSMDVFLDSCHSGTATREIGYTGIKSIRLEEAVRRPNRMGAMHKLLVVDPTMKETLWAGCASTQTSAEVVLGGMPRGAFSYVALQVFQAHPTYTRKQLDLEIAKQFLALGFTDQTPQLECSTTEANEPLFT